MFLNATANGASALSSSGATAVATAAPPAERSDQRRHHDGHAHRGHVGGAHAVHDLAAEPEADHQHRGVDEAAADALRDPGDLRMQHPGEQSGRHEARAERERDRPDADQLARREEDERRGEHEADAVRDQHEDQEVRSRDLGDIGVGRDQRGGRRGGDQEEAEPERIVEADGQRDECEGERGERHVQAEQDEAGAQLDRPLAPGQRPDGEQRLQGEGRHRESARGARRREGGAQPEADEHGRSQDQRGAEDPRLRAVAHGVG